MTAARDALATFDTRGASATVMNNLGEVRDALQAATTADGRPLATVIADAVAEADTIAGPLAEIVERAVTAAREVDPTDDDAVEQARDTVQAAQTACRGGHRAANCR